MADPKDPKAPDPVVTGGPAPEPDPEPVKLVTVKHGGRELQVPEDVAAAWQEREQEFQQRFSKQGAELGELRKRATAPPPEPRREEPREPDINTLWFENPKAAYEQIKREVREEIVSEYQRDQSLRTFWDGFYRANDDLREDEWVVRAQMNEHLSELADLPVREAQKKLADYTRSELLRIARKVKTPDNDRTRTLLEPASGDRPTRPAAQDDDDGPNTLSDAIREMRRRATGKVRAKGA